MKFLVDGQLPGTLARWLRRRGCDAVHVLERDLGQMDDRTLWRIAGEEGRILIRNQISSTALDQVQVKSDAPSRYGEAAGLEESRLSREGWRFKMSK